MSELAGILGLVFVVIFFNFSYPQSAMDLLLKAMKYYHSIHPENLTSEHRILLLNVKGHSFLQICCNFLLHISLVFSQLFLYQFTICLIANV